MTELVARLPKEIQWNIVRFLSLPTADMIRDEAEKILQNYLSLTAEERKKYKKVPNIQAFLKTGRSNILQIVHRYGYDGSPVYITNYKSNILSSKLFKNFGLICGDCGAETKIKRKLYETYLDRNRIEYKQRSHIKTLIKIVQDIPNSEEKYETKTESKIKTKIKTKKTKKVLILVD
jgi:hypothetical protein